MQSDPFHDRLDAVRARFAASLEGKIKETCAQLPTLAGKGAEAADAVAASYRRIHGICGVGGAVGFTRTGRAARDVEDVLVGPFRGSRGLAADELEKLERGLATLSAAAAAELSLAPSAAKAEG
jgi:hypothetical protein